MRMPAPPQTQEQPSCPNKANEDGACIADDNPQDTEGPDKYEGKYRHKHSTDS